MTTVEVWAAAVFRMKATYEASVAVHVPVKNRQANAWMKNRAPRTKPGKMGQLL